MLQIVTLHGDYQYQIVTFSYQFDREYRMI